MSTLTVAAMEGAALSGQACLPAVGDVLVIAEPDGAAAIHVGCRLAARGRGSVTGCAMPHRFRYGRPHGGEPTVMALLEDAPARQRSDDLSGGHAGAQFIRESLLAGASDPQWAVLGTDYLAGLKQLCSWHDLIVVQRFDAGHARPLGGLDDLALHSGLPLLILPTPCAPGATHDRVVIAYDGSLPATRALRSALPLIIAARHVHLLDGSDGRAAAPHFDPLRFLARYGVTASRKHVPRHSLDAAQLLARMARLKPDLIVMGAYGHAPLRERLLGGTTQHVLASSDMATALLIQH